MRNKFIYPVWILLLLLICCCKCHRNPGITDCAVTLNSKCLSVDTSMDVDKYVEDITGQVSALSQKKMKKFFDNCTKPEMVMHCLRLHPLIDTVTITPSGHGISFLRNDTNVWSNIIMD